MPAYTLRPGEGAIVIISSAEWTLIRPLSAITGFYYVCVDFNPQQSSAVHVPALYEEDVEMAASPTNVTPSTTKADTPARSRRVSLNRAGRRAGRSASRGCPSNVATMSGFYFHQNSEP